MAIKLGVIALAGPDNGGTYQYTLSMLQALRHATDFDITLFGDAANADFVEMGYPIIPFKESRTKRLSALMLYRMHLKMPDPFVSQDILLSPIYSLTLLHTAKPFAFTLHDTQEVHYPENFSWLQRAWRWQLNSRLLEKASSVICESPNVKADITGLFGVPADRIAVIPAPPLQQLAVDESANHLQAVRDRLRLPDRFLFYPAQFWTHKNHVRLIEAFRDVLPEVSGLKLVLTGKKRDGYKAVMIAVAEYGLSQQVCHLGYVRQEDVQAIYRLATALVMPSLFESVSIPIYEAFQAGTPVAASGILGISEQVGDAGLLFDPTSVESIKEAILKLVRNPDLARSLGEKGREKMRAMTQERYGAQLQDMLRGLQQ